MFDDDYNDKELIKTIVEAFDAGPDRSTDSLSDRVARMTCALSIGTFLKVLFRIQGFDEDLFQVIRGQLAQFFMHKADIEYVRELWELNQLMFNEDPDQLLLGLQKLFAKDDGVEAFQTAVESVDLWEDEMKNLYFLYLSPSNDLPI